MNLEGMKRYFFILLFLSLGIGGLQAFTVFVPSKNEWTDSKKRITVHIYNDTGADVLVVTGLGSHYKLIDAKFSAITLVEKETIYLEKNGGKGKELLFVTQENNEKRYILSDLL